MRIVGRSGALVHEYRRRRLLAALAQLCAGSAGEFASLPRAGEVPHTEVPHFRTVVDGPA